MRSGTKLVIVFTLAAGLMSSAAMAAAVSAGAGADIKIEVQDVTMEDGKADKIRWEATGGAKSAVEKGNELQDLKVQPPAGPEDVLAFLGNRSETRRDVYYRPFDSALGDIPDRGPTLKDQFPDKPEVIRAFRENPEAAHDYRVLAVIAAAYPAPGNDSFGPDGRTVTPTDELIAQVAATVPTPEDPPPTLNSEYVRAVIIGNLVDDKERRFLIEIYRNMLKYEKEGLVYPLPEGIADVLLKVKDKVEGVIGKLAHDVFHHGSPGA